MDIRALGVSGMEVRALRLSGMELRALGLYGKEGKALGLSGMEGVSLESHGREVGQDNLPGDSSQPLCLWYSQADIIAILRSVGPLITVYMPASDCM